MTAGFEKVGKLTTEHVLLLERIWHDYIDMKICGHPVPYMQRVNGHKARKLISAGLVEKRIYHTETQMQWQLKEFPYYAPTEAGLTLAQEICTPPVSKIDRRCYAYTDKPLVEENRADWTDVYLDMVRRNNHFTKMMKFYRTLDNSEIASYDSEVMKTVFNSRRAVLDAIISLRMN